MIQRITQYYEQKIVIGVSSGVDSMVLFDLLKNHDIVVAHINHNVREESEFEQTYLRDFCLKRNIPFETITLEYTKEELLENFQLLARNKRYSFFKRVMVKYDADVLALAHHGDDLVETILMSMTRGTSLRGLIGFGEQSTIGTLNIIRPLLKYSKDEIITYAEENEIVFFEDASNSTNKYTRNRYRSQVLPFLKEETPNIHLKYVSMSEDLQDIHDYLMIEVNKFIDSERRVSDFQRLHIAVQREIIATILKRQSIPFNSNLLNEIISILSSSGPNAEIHLPNNLVVIREYDSFSIRNNVDPINFDIEIKDFGTYVLPTGDRISVTQKKDDFNTHSYKLCYNNLVFPIRVRNRRMGDKMTLPFGTKKVKSLFIDQKIPKLQRETLPLILLEEEIIWIPGIKEKRIEGKNYIYIGYQKGDYYG